MAIEIPSWITGNVLFRSETATNTKEALEEAVRSGASLVGARLDRAHLEPIRDDFFSVLDAAPLEVTALRDALRQGQVDGSAYEGKCACLVGTIANARGCSYKAVDGLQPDSSRLAEVWFLAIAPGDTPENHPVARIVYGWLLEWQARHAAAPAPAAPVAATP